MTQPQVPSRSMALSGTFHDSARASQLLEAAAKMAHLITPATHVGQLPEGFSIAVSLVTVGAADTYPIAGEGAGGKRGLGKGALDRIALAAGVSWDPQLSGRVDDGSEPMLVHWKVVGHVRQFDGTTMTIVGERLLDARDDAPAILALKRAAESKGKTAETQIRELRTHLASHAETKARMRAIRSLGVRTSYTVEELRRPFAVAKTFLSGEGISDPETKRELTLMMARAAVDSHRLLYGAAPRTGMALPARAPTPPALPEPDDDDESAPADDAPTTTTVQPGPTATTVVAEAATPPAAEPAAAPDPDARILGGREKGTPLAYASLEALSYWAERVSGQIARGEVRGDPARARAWSAAAEGELQRRRGAQGGAR